ncbi:MAG: bifunctional DNA-formamidopyrimidine glycosylase/DNA-(apurinic or apyrimidinic site) lyase [Candidatus Nitronauta litoralis]|uniref:Formamidopyrimidine-DNA glycosylase n=1 Tax=Candidatus Nitronauta litoralis TaxID=2705533 RepID=A0A7T0BXP4_9BACT|nr:MAG: bifunctional DNA-formamidopyrimidine glycosylase/DNA-(apurinic or apyrimidinic site) lyase [Candidatus Nitronauta litoralis]
MPELPEVETLKRALEPLILDKKFKRPVFFRQDLRFPIPIDTLQAELPGRTLNSICRKAKYLLLETGSGAMLWHLGMSGRVTQYPTNQPQEKHTHAVFSFSTDLHLHFIDPRRFGAILWIPRGSGHKLLDSLGPDPLELSTTGDVLFDRAKTCKGPVKNFLMNSQRLSGVGNIYACEALFKARISPRKGAHRLSKKDWNLLLISLRTVLEKSIAAGGTTLRDFFDANGQPGYFVLDLAVYGKEGEPCKRCGSEIARIVQTGRSTFFCKTCQKK